MAVEIELKPDERVDDLLLYDLKIIQSEKFFCFSMDAVLLANFALLRKGDKVIDLGTGNGVIPLLLTIRRPAPEKIWGVEIQEQVAQMAEKSVVLNGLKEKITIIRGDIKEVPSFFAHGCMDVVITNPPYTPVGNGKFSPYDAKAVARHEILCSLEDVIKVSAFLLKYRGRMAMVHRPTRLTDIFLLMCKYGIEPKRLRLVYPRLGEKPNMVLVEGIRGGQRELVLEPPLIIYGAKGEYSEEMREIYYGSCQ